MTGREPFQAAEPQKSLIIPDRPKADIGRLQPSEVQGMSATRSRLCSGAGEVDMKEIDHARVTEVALDNSHHE